MAEDFQEQQALLQPVSPTGNAGNPRTVIDRIPLASWTVIIVQSLERFAYFGVTVPMQNYVQLSTTDVLRPGGLGLGQQTATLVRLLFAFWCYTTPIFAAVLADQSLGRLRTVAYSAFAYLLGLSLLWLSSMQLLDLMARRTLLLPAMVLIGLGAGGFKAHASLLLAEQYVPPANGIRRDPTGEVVVVDHTASIQRIFLVAYMMENVGALSPLLTTYLELRPRGGFALSFLVPLCVFAVSILVFHAVKARLKDNPPSRSVVIDAIKVLTIAAGNDRRLSAARPSLHPSGSASTIFGIHIRISYDDNFPAQVGQALCACRTFMIFPFYWMAYVQMSSSLISQAGTMEDHGIPNDLLPVASTVLTIVTIPALDRIVYPWLRDRALEPSPSNKIRLAFLLCSASMAWSAILQHRIYKTPPCFQYPGSNSCPQANKIHIALQLPAYVLLSWSEILITVTGLQLAYARAPITMRSMINAVCISTVGIGALMSSLLSPLMHHPMMVWFYSSLAVVVGAAGLLFSTRASYGENSVPTRLEDQN